MLIDIEFLGTGSAFSKKFGNNSAMVTVYSGEGEEETLKTLLIDCGRTTPDDLAYAGYTLENIDAIFITHLHGDHVYGLEELAFKGRFIHNKKPHIIFPHKKLKADLWDKVLKGTLSDGDLDRKMTFDDYFTYEIVDDTDQYFIFNDTMFSVYSTQHVKNKKSYGLIIGEYNPVVYTSDSLFDQDFLLAMEQAEDLQAVFHDCQFEDYEGKVHASLSELETLPEEIREKTYIMHYGDNLAEVYSRIKEAKLNIANKESNYYFSVG